MTLSRPEPPSSWSNLPFFRTDWPVLWQKLAALPDWQPAPDAIFRALELTPRPEVRVIILGQDPYHTRGRATGLAFSFPPQERPRDSLRNILTEVGTDTGSVTASGDWTGWARQGVLLLNTVLTVPVGAAHGHKSLGWSPLVRQVLEAVATDGPKAFILWGQPAHKACAHLTTDGHLFLTAPHPSPLSAHRGFFGSRAFSKVNRWLTSQGQPSIDWST